MKTKFTILAMTALMINIKSHLNAQQTINGFEAPESVVKVYDKLFVSNIGGAQPNPTALDSNGLFPSYRSMERSSKNIFQKPF